MLSCDNLQGNGDYARQAVVGFARLVESELADWIDANVVFPNCMVDRITPSTTDADRAALSREFGIDDGWPVPAEPFTQWIVEDEFPTGRPALESVDVQFVDDVRPYELMKLRLLNASHQAIAYFGAPLRYVLVDEALRDDRIRTYLERYMADEAAPTLGELPGIDLAAYMATLIERFSNPGIRDTLVRLATDGSNRMATFTLPAIRANIDAGRPIRLGAAMVAAWAEYWALIGRGEIVPPEVPDDVYAAGDDRRGRRPARRGVRRARGAVRGPRQGRDVPGGVPRAALLARGARRARHPRRPARLNCDPGRLTQHLPAHPFCWKSGPHA